MKRKRSCADIMASSPTDTKGVLVLMKSAESRGDQADKCHVHSHRDGGERHLKRHARVFGISGQPVRTDFSFVSVNHETSHVSGGRKEVRVLINRHWLKRRQRDVNQGRLLLIHHL